MPVAKISPSMLSSDFAYLAAESKRMFKNGAEWLHLGKQ
jgi:ribulose-phosphate 3-epimerase